MPSRLVNTIPSHDLVLRRVVDRVTKEVPPDTSAELAERLRSLYPRIAVVERQLSGERSLLYVYRDGRYMPDAPEQWWTGEGIASIRLSRDTSTLTFVSPEWASLMGAPDRDLVGRPFLDFVLPEAEVGARALLETVAGEREARSEVLVRRPDGSTLGLEFHATHPDDEVEVCFRPLQS
jgi:PAS domain-containing protein